MKVLVVDDNQALLSMIGLLLEGEGHEAVLFESPIQAAFEARTQAFDLLITDVCMPQYSGQDLVDNVRLNRVNRNIPVLLISAHPHAAEMLGNVGRRACFLRKPFSSQSFCKAVTRLRNCELS